MQKQKLRKTYLSEDCEINEEGKIFLRQFFNLRLQGYEALLNGNKVWSNAKVERSTLRCKDPWGKGIRETLIEIGVLPPCLEISSPVSVLLEEKEHPPRKLIVKNKVENTLESSFLDEDPITHLQLKSATRPLPPQNNMGGHPTANSPQTSMDIQ